MIKLPRQPCAKQIYLEFKGVKQKFVGNRHKFPAPVIFFTSSYWIVVHKNGGYFLIFAFTGDLESAPSLVRKSEDNCLYEFEWHTAAACPLGQKFGTDCTVFDDDAGRW